ncbi:hypothetical protein TIFTF001_016787 [Ficus carica]|uniref:Uncharacterized protein n=1 Tax=Ficus carica TaxID=3494 RepID=A0AA88AB23_FICCA|nr:hypothetical protein TIFTF001_016787 [Ficus carica]
MKILNVMTNDAKIYAKIKRQRELYAQRKRSNEIYTPAQNDCVDSEIITSDVREDKSGCNFELTPTCDMKVASFEVIASDNAKIEAENNTFFSSEVHTRCSLQNGIVAVTKETLQWNDMDKKRLPFDTRNKQRMLLSAKRVLANNQLDANIKSTDILDVEKNAAEDTVVLKEGMTTIAPSRRWQELYGKRNKMKQVDHIMKSGSVGIIINWSNTYVVIFFTRSSSNVRKCSEEAGGIVEPKNPNIKSKGFCCSDGGIILKENVVSDELYELFTSTCDEACEFKTNVRIYNGNFAFPSLGVKYDKDLRRLDKYVYTEHLKLTASLLLTITEAIEISPSSPFLYEFSGTLGIPCSISLGFALQVLPTGSYANNASSASQVAAIRVDDNVSAEHKICDITVSSHSGETHKINYYFGCCDPLQYPLVFPHGDTGWHQGIEKVNLVF